jgi:endonuclease VIII
VPEGDTIHRTAAVLRAALLGRELVGFDAPRWSGITPAVGSLIEEVRARGKHLEICFDDELILHTHMLMSGSWHVYRQGEQWRKSPKQLRAAVEVPGWTAVCFSAPIVEVYRAKDRRRHPGLGSLGPDLCDPAADLTQATARFGRFVSVETSIAEALLDQRVAAGIGNVFKSEVLWACRVDPFAPIGTIDEPTRTELLATAAEMLRANLGGPTRVTTNTTPEGLAVYGRTSRPCPRCKGAIQQRKHGEQARLTYWCPLCQLRPHSPITRDGQRVETASTIDQ